MYSDDADVRSVSGAEAETMPAYVPEGMAEELIDPASIIGSDNRVKVDPNTYPYSAVMFLRLGQDTTGDKVANLWSQRTGWMAGSKALVTAGHCFWSKDLGWVEECRIYKKQNSSTPNSTYYYPASWVCSTAYTKSDDSNYDWCVVTMQNRLGDELGYFGYGYGGTRTGKSITVAGYPGDKYGYQYRCTGTVSYEDTYNLRYNADTTGGQSGSPVYDSAHISWAVHTRGSSSYNFGNRITKQVFDLISEARAK